MAHDFSSPIKPESNNRHRNHRHNVQSSAWRPWRERAVHLLETAKSIPPSECATAFRSIARCSRARGVLVAAAVALGVLLLSTSPRMPALAYNPALHHETLPTAVPEQEETAGQAPVRSTTIRRGDSASTALRRLGFSSRDVLAMSKAARPHHPLTRVHPGQRMVRQDKAGATELSMDLDAIHTLRLVRRDSDLAWHADLHARPISTRRITAGGTIRDNLFLDAARAGLDDRTTMQLVDIFGWDIDFARNLRKGDRFSLLLEERFDDRGKRIGSTILAAEFINRGKKFQAIRFTDDKGNSAYYAPDGSSMRKNYLKAPVKFTRISSRFRLARKHPILGYTRAHRGVDYAAPSGTPVHAIGAGRIVYFGRRGGYGRFIQIRHRNRHHSTAYAHLRRYARGLHRGSWVEQGQVIGYVGMSGLATGPHLHFEFRVDGRAINPLHIRRTPARPVAKRLRHRFETEKRRLLLALHEQPQEVAWQ